MLWENLFRIEKGLGWTYLGIKMVGKEIGDKNVMGWTYLRKNALGLWMDNI